MPSKADSSVNMMFCGYCGERLPALGDGQSGRCPECSRSFGQRKRIRRPPPPPVIRYGGMEFETPTLYANNRFRDPVLAALLSAIVPGAGQVYNYQFFKGVLVLLTCWLVIPYFLGILDAFLAAEKANRWQAVAVGSCERSRR